MTFYQKIRAAQKATKSLLCIGLDVDVEKLPPVLRSRKNPVYIFNRDLIEATADLACAYKLNLAFYEAQGQSGWETIEKTIACIPDHVLTIADGKRGDIGNTAGLYARSVFDQMGFDSCTVNPYMGEDSVRPFLSSAKHGVFVLALTSNPGALDFQYLRINRKPLYQHVVQRVASWNSRNNCGLVVGATRPDELLRIRSLTPDMPFLIPGVGTQGGSLEMAVRHGCTANGDMAIINVGRSVVYASSGRDFAQAARSAALVLRNEINLLRENTF